MSNESKKKVTEAQKKATAKYNAKAYDRIELRVNKGRKEIISKAAKANSESVNALINRAIDRELDRLNAETPQNGGRINVADYIIEAVTGKK